ncbi:MAG: hypothetical protein WCH46_06620 [bacterium]
MTEERILDFLDGNLHSSEEEELMHRLAVSPEQRGLLKQHLQMRELTSALAKQQFVTVPKALTASLFTTLAASGYTGPQMPATIKESVVATQTAGTGFKAPIATQSVSPIFQRRSLVLSALLLAFISGSVVTYFTVGTTDQYNIAQLNSTPATASKVQSARTINEMITVPSSSESIMGNTKANISTRSITLDKPKNLHRIQEVVSNENSFPLSSSTAPTLLSQPRVAEIASRPLRTLEPVPSSDIHGDREPIRSPFLQPDYQSADTRSTLERLNFGFHFGEGKAPGNEQALTGSLRELSVSYDLSELFSARMSIGQFLPYETQAVAAKQSVNSDGLALFQLSPVLKSRAVIGAGIGMKFSISGSPLEIDGGMIADFQGNILPRGGLFTSLILTDFLTMNIGIEALIYSHDIRPSISAIQTSSSGGHSLLIGTSKNKEMTGYIGPSIEFTGHF